MVDIALEVDKQINSLSADAENHLVSFSFDRIEGTTRVGRLSDFGFEGLSELIDLLTQRFGRFGVSLVG